MNSTVVGIAAITGDLYGAARGNFKSVQDIVGSAKNVWRNNDGTTFADLNGGFMSAADDFNSMDFMEGSVKIRENSVLSGTLKNGDKVTARQVSLDGRPTLQINHSDGTKTEIRYNEN